MPQTEWTYEREHKEPKKKKVMPVQFVQLTVCALLVLCVFGLGKTQSSAFRAVQAKYRAWTAQDLCADGVWTAAQRMAQSVWEPVEPSSAPAEETTAVIHARAEIETVTSSGGEDIRVLDALKNATFEAVTVSQEAVLPVEGKVTSGFGYRVHPVTGNRSFHTGIDIAAAQGTPVCTAYSGTVQETGYTSGRGNYILVKHGESLQTLYCHLSEITAQKGQSVTAGAQIGLVGSTGMSTGPHLHFELRVDGIRCNPVYVLKNLDYA